MPESRIIGVDVGDRRVGIAVSDPGRVLASPRGVITQSGRARAAAEVARIAAAEGVDLVIVGLPLTLRGDAGPQAERARRFGAELVARHGLAVDFWDERLTTVEATRRLRESGMRREKRAASVDATAAAILLQSYLDARRGGGG